VLWFSEGREEKLGMGKKRRSFTRNWRFWGCYGEGLVRRDAGRGLPQACISQQTYYL
jgi:hypothetical protein